MTLDLKKVTDDIELFLLNNPADNKLSADYKFTADGIDMILKIMADRESAIVTIPPKTKEEIFMDYLTEDIRLFLNDDPENNELLADYEFTSKDVALALKMTLQKANIIPPIITAYFKIKLENFNRENYFILFPGIIGNMYKGKALAEKRNELQYSDDGQSVNEDHRFSDYFNIGNAFTQEFETNISNVKKVMNESMAFGVSMGFRDFACHFGY